MANLIATGTTEINSIDFTLVDGQTCALNLFVAAGASLQGCRAVVQVKASNGEYYDLLPLVDANTPNLIVQGPGTFRVVRKASATSFGVDKN